MDHEEHPQFSGPSEEIEYWKSLAEKYYEEKNEIQRELEDYAEDSRQLEKELETSLTQAEKKIKELQLLGNRTQNELESLRNKLEQSQCEVSQLQSDVHTLNNEKVQLTRYVRELEQKNDDLERAERVVAESVAAVEASLNMAIERNAILESEVDEKETLKVKLQRLVDETRDLKQELMVKERAPDNERGINGHGPPPTLLPAPTAIDSNRLRVEMETQTSPLKREHPVDSHEISMRQPTRVMALNLVNEILRKIGKLETKIAAHRANERNLSQSDINRTQRRLNRGTSSPSTRLSFGN
ncbi:nudE [Carabus blaptoides fortunei]